MRCIFTLQVPIKIKTIKQNFCFFFTFFIFHFFFFFYFCSIFNCILSSSTVDDFSQWMFTLEICVCVYVDDDFHLFTLSFTFVNRVQNNFKNKSSRQQIPYSCARFDATRWISGKNFSVFVQWRNNDEMTTLNKYKLQNEIKNKFNGWHVKCMFNDKTK